MGRMEHDLADARDRAQGLINLELRRYSRRLKGTASDLVNEAYAECAISGRPFDHLAVAQEAIEEAKTQWSQTQIEAS